MYLVSHFVQSIKYHEQQFSAQILRLKVKIFNNEAITNEMYS